MTREEWIAHKSAMTPAERRQYWGHAKLDADWVREIRRRKAEGQKGLRIALDLGISESVVSRICSGKAWADVPDLEPIGDDAA